MTVKETVDFLYEYLIQHSDGVQFALDSLGGKTERTIATILVRRGIIERTNLSPLPGEHGRKCKYRWAATLAPTKTLYGSIVQEIRDAHRAWPSHNNTAKSKNAEGGGKEEHLPIQTAEEPQETPHPEFTGLATLDGFSDKELWDELKKRGYSIEDNRLVIIKKTYLD